MVNCTKRMLDPQHSLHFFFFIVQIAESLEEPRSSLACDVSVAEDWMEIGWRILLLLKTLTVVQELFCLFLSFFCLPSLHSSCLLLFCCDLLKT